MAVRISLFRAKIHRATVTHADVDYEGSVTIDGALMDAAGIYEYEQIHIWNVTRGTRLTTYTLRGDEGSGIICINGAAAHLASPGDKVILATFAEVDPADAVGWQPKVILCDEQNRIVSSDHHELAGPKRRTNAA
jgi:aspartate 1-decarboxylase